MTTRILYVEDNDDTRELVSLLLTEASYEVVGTQTCVHALRLAQTSQFGLYIVDRELLDGSGLGLCRQLRAFDSRTPILFCSGYTTEADRAAAHSAGSQGYLTKPFDPEHLLAAVAKLLPETKPRATN